MKSKYVTTALLLLSIHFSFCQQKIIDSLEQQLINPTNGKDRWFNLTNLGHYYSYINPKKSIIKLDEAIELIRKKKDTFHLSSVYGTKALVYANTGNDSLAYKLYDRAINICRVMDSTRYLVSHLYNKGLMQSGRSHYSDALKTYREVLEVATSRKDTMLMGRSLGQLAYSSIYTGAYTSSLNYFLHGITLLEQANMKETSGYASLKANMATLYEKLGKYDEAIELENEALDFFIDQKNQFMIAAIYNGIGILYEKKKKYQDALMNYQSACEIFKQLGMVNEVASTYNNIGSIYSEFKNYKKGIIYFDSATVINKRLKNYGLLSENYSNKGYSYLKTNEILKAKKNYDSALNYVEKVKDLELIHSIKLGLAETASKQKNYKEAYKNLEEAKTLKGSLLSDEKKEELAVLKAQYEFDKEKAIIEADFQKEKAIEKARTEREIFIRNLSIGGGLFLIIVLSGSFLLWRKKREAEYNAQLSVSELQSLKAQMNPHFIFNTLTSINDYVLKNEKESASNYLTQFSTMVRRVLENTEEEDTSLDEEIKLLKSYVALEQKRTQHNFSFKVDVDEKLNPKITLLPPSLVQPFLENSIWHGLSGIKDGLLLLSFSRSRNNLICVIEDNGIGLPNNELKSPVHKSFGLENVKNRLRLLNQSKKSNANFEINNKEGNGVKVTLTLPLLLDE